MTGECILVVDDHASIVDLARLYLEREGYRVESASDGARGLEKARSLKPALMILDLMLPEVDGYEVCRRVRQESDLPILMLTARDDDVDKIVGLELGADDYLTKPFNPRELVARVRAILRRSEPAARGAEQPLHLGDLTIDPGSREVSVAGRSVALRAKEFDLLLALAQHNGLVLSREQLLNLAWGYEFYGQTRTVDVHIAQLRKRLAASALRIETVTGIGYKLVT
jgi:DNA-binding response OmpR family regulator